jgi:hypothetical protein
MRWNAVGGAGGMEGDSKDMLTVAAVNANWFPAFRFPARQEFG